jgi:predicted RNA binding protein YcfA (HicA-like mRNA interferase family)
MPKAARVLAALKRDGWTETRRSGSHRVLVKGSQQQVWAYHDGVDLGGPAMARIAKDYGYTLDELRKLLDLLMSMLRVELFYDDEAGNWHYRVPALHINGGGHATREEAERGCLAAIEFALQGDPHDYDTSAQALTFDVSIAPAAWPRPT